MRFPSIIGWPSTVGWVLVVGLLAAKEAAADVSEISLGQLTASAEEIVVGRVAAVREIALADGAPIHVADVDVVERWKGEPHDRVHYLADGTWTCDTSQACVGETCLLFLAPLAELPDEAPVPADRFAQGAGGRPLLQVAHAGRGRMPLREVAGTTYATLHADDVRLPSAVATIPGPDPRWARFTRSAPLEALHTLVTARLKPSSPARTPTEAFVLALLRGLDLPYPTSDVAAWALDQLADEDARPFLRRLAANETSPERENAIRALDLGDEEDAEELLGDLAAGDPARRRSAVYWIEVEARRSPIWPDVMGEALARATRDEDPVVRGHALTALARLENAGCTNEQQVFGALVRGLGDEDAEVARRAVVALRTLIEWSSYVFFEYAETQALRVEAEAVLRRRVATEGGEALRRALWETLSYAATPATAQVARAALEDTDPVVRGCATAALARAEGTAAVERLAPACAGPAPGSRAAAHALSLTDAAEAVAPLIAALDHADPLTAEVAAWALGELGPKAKSALPILEAHLQNADDADERYTLEESITSIRGDR